MLFDHWALDSQADARQGAATHAAAVSASAGPPPPYVPPPKATKGAKASSSSSSSKAAKAAPVLPSGKVSKKVDKNDKDRIKRAPSPYIIFCTETRTELKAKNPEASFGELGRLLGQIWGTMDDTAKAPYNAKAEVLKAASIASTASAAEK